MGSIDQSAGLIGHGITFGISDLGSPAVVTEVGEMMDVSGPGFTKAAVGATSTDSKERWAQFISGIRDGGEITFSVMLIQVNTEETSGLLAELYKDILSKYELNIPGITKNLEISGFLTAYNPTEPIEDKMTIDVTIKVSGKPEWVTP